MKALLPLSLGLAMAVTPLPGTAQQHAGHGAAAPQSAQSGHAGHASPYAGMETRAIKSLSDKDIEELRSGTGWGLALSAELNGVPGPAHLLELKTELGLSPQQVSSIEAIHKAMKAEAIPAGERLIAAEAAIETAFVNGPPTEASLRKLVQAAEAARAELRYIHLARHISTPPLLTREQIAKYQKLRGYGAADRCAAVPQGHDPEMWRRHNGCD